MSISFDVNQKALKSMATKPLNKNSIGAVFNGRTKATVESCGATHTNVIGNYPEVSNTDYLEGMDKPFRDKYAAQVPGVSAFSHGLMEAVHIAYADHYPLVLSPDTIWLTIAQGFANHVNVNAEKLRKRFVAHEGKKMILIERDHFSKGNPDNDWQGCFAEFSDKIEEHIGKKRDLVVSKFSTTNPISKAASELVLMDSMKAYFKYAVRTMCGIPHITLLGSAEDWQNVKTRVENLAEYELDWWVNSLVPVMSQFVSASEGKVDVSFWDSMYKKNGGSGGPYCSGWVNTLFPYVENYKGNFVKNSYAETWNTKNDWAGGPTMDEYPNSLSKVPFKWQVMDHTYDMEFLGGIVGSHQDEKTLSLEPSIGWAVRDTGVSREGEIDEKEDW